MLAASLLASLKTMTKHTAFIDNAQLEGLGFRNSLPIVAYTFWIGWDVVAQDALVEAVGKNPQVSLAQMNA